jgi:lambda repressor-like predicted transcriptional regulator
MNPNDIKAAISKAGTTQAAIADHLGISKNSLWRVVNGTMRSARIEAELQKITGRPIYTTKLARGRQKSVWTGRAVHTAGGAV